MNLNYAWALKSLNLELTLPYKNRPQGLSSWPNLTQTPYSRIWLVYLMASQRRLDRIQIRLIENLRDALLEIHSTLRALTLFKIVKGFTVLRSLRTIFYRSRCSQMIFHKLRASDTITKVRIGFKEMELLNILLRARMCPHRGLWMPTVATNLSVVSNMKVQLIQL